MMKTPFRKVRGLGLHKHDKRDRHAKQRSLAQLDELSQASQDMQDMRDCYDSLLSAAAGTSNNAYEFSESLQEMGDCLLEKTALNDDEDSGRVLLMLGKVQFDIQKLIDNYRSHISQTITVPSESLLNELRIVEEMKRECDEKRISYEEMKIQYDKGRMKASKGENITSRQLQSARDEFDEAATLFIFRMKSLKRGQSRSLLTQAARHYAAQMCFFRKALKSLEAIEPQVKSTTEQQHIDYNFSALEEEDDDRDSLFLTDDDENDSDDNYETLEENVLNIESRMNVKRIEASSSRKSIEMGNEDLTFPRVSSVNSTKGNTYGKPLWNSNTFNRDVNKGSKSAPLSAENNNTFDANERYRQMRQSSTRKLNTYVLPTPLEKTQPIQQPNNNIYHSMPLQHKKYENISKIERSSGPMISTQQSVLKENSDTKPTPLPPPQTEVVTLSGLTGNNNNNIKRYAFSGPLTGDLKSKKPVLTSFTQPLTTSRSAKGVTLPVISELHELPRPPTIKKPSRVGFSAPLVGYKSGPNTLPVPLTSQRDALLASKQTKTWNLRTDVVPMVSPPLSPIPLRNI